MKCAGQRRQKSAVLIQQMKTEIAEARHLTAEGKWAEAIALAEQKKARGVRKPGKKQEISTTL